MHLWIMQLGVTHPSLSQSWGDFDDWCAESMGLPKERLRVCRVFDGEVLPEPESVGGVVLTGAHEMVTDRLPWSVRMAEWLERYVTLERPVLGICYGHQLLADALGGTVGRNPNGPEIGTVGISFTADARNDALFGTFTDKHEVYVSHYQSALVLPTGSVILATGEREPHHAVRFAPKCWGVQFHPEFTADISRAYIEANASELREEGYDPERLVDGMQPVTLESNLMRRFAALVTNAA